MLRGEGERGWARSRIIWPQESMVLYKSFNTLWGYPSCPKVFMFILPGVVYNIIILCFVQRRYARASCIRYYAFPYTLLLCLLDEFVYTSLSFYLFSKSNSLVLSVFHLKTSFAEYGIQSMVSKDFEQHPAALLPLRPTAAISSFCGDQQLRSILWSSAATINSHHLLQGCNHQQAITRCDRQLKNPQLRL